MTVRILDAAAAKPGIASQAGTPAPACQQQTLSTADGAPAAAAPILPVDGGVFVPVNCPSCGGRYTVEGRSRGREDMASPCLEVRGVLFCARCRERRKFTVTLDAASYHRGKERPFTGRSWQ